MIDLVCLDEDILIIHDDEGLEDVKSVGVTSDGIFYLQFEDGYRKFLDKILPDSVKSMISDYNFCDFFMMKGNVVKSYRQIDLTVAWS